MKIEKTQKNAKAIRVIAIIILAVTLVPISLEVPFLAYYGHSVIPEWLFVVLVTVAVLSAVMTNFRLSEGNEEQVRISSNSH